MTSHRLSRRRFAAALGAAMVIAPSRIVFAAGPTIKVTRDPGCGCCEAWADHLKANGFAVTVVDDPKINRLKAKLGVPSELASCHTAEVEGYVIEGHVPAGAIKRLLSQRPKIKGLAVPGMPVGSPGMEVEGRPPETYSVMAFGPGGKTVFARYKGADDSGNLSCRAILWRTGIHFTDCALVHVLDAVRPAAECTLGQAWLP